MSKDLERALSFTGVLLLGFFALVGLTIALQALLQGLRPQPHIG
ncbi:hypothetical protein [Nocardioides caricicola]|uniref:Uncharacterized protein n=1 Tax=Nocardioides caricicola TaxID=634770 RepID=A0ABW0MZV4_9ACTN